ncbi:MAG: RsmB/NOP family class I SAM-dependent RNA methyltransferase [Rhodospirillales bacterium]|nr:RsmB/NOP family class I SAM-dependent RNA methyltransferase [Rhodospirillales bacterium]
MTPGARVQAAIEILDAIAAAAAPADQVAGGYFRGRRFIGAKDRAAIAALVYGVLRRRAQLDWWSARQRTGASRGLYNPDGRQRILAHLAIVDGWPVDEINRAFDGDRFRPRPLSPAERETIKALAGRSLDHPEQSPAVRHNFPAWLEPALWARFGGDFAAEMTALAAEAPLDLRANALMGAREEAARLLAMGGLEATPTPLSPWGLRLEGRAPLSTQDAFKSGLIEVQDEGSQLAALFVDVRPGMRVCDFCAGAGGKSLAIAARMENKGHVVACDTSRRRLKGATKRLRRAGAFNVQQRALTSESDPWVKRHRASFDRVLVDAPCTGTGTWRRNPDAKWTLKPEDLAELADKQRRILDSAARLVKPGGRLVYVTCSLLAEENERQVEAILDRDRDFSLVPASQVWASAIGGTCPSPDPYLRLSPARHGTDGFFVAVLTRKPENAKN